MGGCGYVQGMCVEGECVYKGMVCISLCREV